MEMVQSLRSFWPVVGIESSGRTRFSEHVQSIRFALSTNHSRSQRPRSFWSAPRIATSGRVQHRKSAIHGLPVTLRMFRVKFDKSDWFWSQSIFLQSHSKTECRWTRPEVAILGADQKERGLWGRECQPIRFARFDGKSVNRGLPVLDQTRGLDPNHRPEGS